MLTKKQFTAKRFALIDRLRRDSDKTPAARLTGAEIIGLANYVSGDAWPGGAYLANKLGLCIRTVRYAIAALTVNKGSPHNYLHLTRSGRSNRYRPNFALLEGERLPLEVSTIETANGATNGLDRCNFCTSIGAKNVPLSLIGNPNTSLQRATADGDARLRDAKGDEKIEREAAEMLGHDGYSILSRLHEIDQGQPRLRLLALIRGGLVTPRDLEAARLAAISLDGRPAAAGGAAIISLDDWIKSA